MSAASSLCATTHWSSSWVVFPCSRTQNTSTKHENHRGTLGPRRAICFPRGLARNKKHRGIYGHTPSPGSCQAVFPSIPIAPGPVSGQLLWCMVHVPRVALLGTGTRNWWYCSYKVSPSIHPVLTLKSIFVSLHLPYWTLQENYIIAMRYFILFACFALGDQVHRKDASKGIT